MAFAGTGLGTVASAKLTTYRIEQLEKKVEKHNSVVERTYRLEGKLEEIEKDIEEMKEVK